MSADRAIQQMCSVKYLRNWVSHAAARCQEVGVWHDSSSRFQPISGAT
jgi:hypothetical protein